MHTKHTYTPHSSFLLGSESIHSQFLKLCSISGCVKRNWEVLMPSKHSEDIQTESWSFMQVKPPFNSLTCQEKTRKLKRQKNPTYFKEESVWNLAATFRHRNTHNTRFAITSFFWKENNCKGDSTECWICNFILSHKFQNLKLSASWDGP